MSEEILDPASSVEIYGTLTQVETLVGVMKLRKHGYSAPSLAVFDKYSERDMAEMLCRLADRVLQEAVDADGGVK